MQKQLLKIGGCLILATLAGCNFNNQAVNKTPAQPSVQLPPSPTQPAPIANTIPNKPVPPAQLPFVAVPVPAKPVPAKPVAGLIPPSDPNRLPQRAAGREDPFAPIIGTPIRVVAARAQTAAAPSNLPVVAPLPAANSANPVPLAPIGTLPSLPVPATGTAPLATVPVAIAPPPSPTALASTIEVSGVMEVNGTVSAIVNLPDQGSRHVRAGEYLSNGQVLVKRIELRPRQEPLVILQQNGIEVTKYVGSSGGAIASAR